MNPLRIGVSTKAYFGYRASLDWLERAIAVADACPAVRDGRLEFFVAPSTPLLDAAVRLARGTRVVISAQDCSEHPAGAHTGETPAELLAELGVGMVELGHAERRRNQGETNVVIGRKVGRAVAAGLTPLLCVGETARRTPVEAARECARQVAAVLDPAGPAVIAYEPIWAIGAERPADPEYVVAVATELRARLGAPWSIVYGGSAGPGLLPGLRPAVDGLFLGRFAHDVAQLGRVLDEASELAGAATPAAPSTPG